MPLNLLLAILQCSIPFFKAALYRFFAVSFVSIVLIQSRVRVDECPKNFEVVQNVAFSDIKDIEKLKDIGIKNVIFGRAFYEGIITLSDLENYLKK